MNAKRQKPHRKQTCYLLEDNKSIVSEQFRMLRTNIEFMSINRPLQNIVVTAADKEVGKTTISFNLATAFALQSKRVLLVDTDLRKPSVHKILSLENDVGLTSLIMNPHYKIDQVIQSTVIDNLSLITSGPIPPNPAECLSSSRMNQVMAELKTHFDIIIYDTPPLTVVADAQIMAGKADGTIFVVRIDQDRKESIRQSKELLDAANAYVIGTVFNRETRKNRPVYYYSYE